MPEAEHQPSPAQQSEPKPAPSVWLAIVVAFCVPMFVLNLLVGMGTFVLQMRMPGSGGLYLLLLACEWLLVVAVFQWFYYQPPCEQVEIEGDRIDPAEQTDAVFELDTVTLAIARRAGLAALLGTAFCPPLLTVYSVWLIMEHELYRDSVRKQTPWVNAAIAVNAIVLTMVLLLFMLAGGLHML
jgi:hypothetical protein